MATRTAPVKPKRARRTAARAEPEIPRAEAIRQMLAELEQLKLPSEDGDRMESDWHAVSIPLLDELVRQHLGEPDNYFCGGNMFIYFSIEQAKEIEEYVEAEAVARKPRFKGPDFFLVKGVDGRKPRESWVVWQEGGRYPNLIVEFVSTSTRKKDVQKNVRFYEEVFRTPEYFWFDHRTGELKGYRLAGAHYEEIVPNAQGWLWSEQLEAYLGAWTGEHRGRRYTWLRLYDKEGRLIPTREEAAQEARRVQAQLIERAEQAEQRAQQAEQRAQQAEQRAQQAEQRAEQERQLREQMQAELERLRQALRNQGVEV